MPLILLSVPLSRLARNTSGGASTPCARDAGAGNVQTLLRRHQGCRRSQAYETLLWPSTSTAWRIVRVGDGRNGPRACPCACAACVLGSDVLKETRENSGLRVRANAERNLSHCPPAVASNCLGDNLCGGDEPLWWREVA